MDKTQNTEIVYVYDKEVYITVLFSNQCWLVLPVHDQKSTELSGR